MSVSIGVFTATAMFLAIGGDSSVPAMHVPRLHKRVDGV